MKRRSKISPFLYAYSISTLIVLSLLATELLVLEYRPVQVGGEKYYFIVTSGSMEPIFNLGEFLVFSRVTFEDVQVGDIIAVRYPHKIGLIIVHRVVEKGDNSLVTKGDANPAPDNFITVPENVLAKFTGFKISILGYVIVFSRTPLGLVLIYYIPCFVLIVIQIKILREKLKRKKTKEWRT